MSNEKPAPAPAPAPAPSERPFGPDTSDTIDALRAEVERLLRGDEQRVRDLTKHIQRADAAEAEVKIARAGRDNAVEQRISREAELEDLKARVAALEGKRMK